MFSRNFPNYSAGFQLNIPIRNRANQADLITDELNYRQPQIQDKQLQNNIKLNVINAQIALKQARAAYETAVQARKLQEQVLAGERRKYELGTSSILNVVHGAARHHRARTGRSGCAQPVHQGAQRRWTTCSARRWKSTTWISTKPRTAWSSASRT